MYFVRISTLLLLLYFGYQSLCCDISTTVMFPSQDPIYLADNMGVSALAQICHTCRQVAIRNVWAHFHAFRPGPQTTPPPPHHQHSTDLSTGFHTKSIH